MLDCAVVPVLATRKLNCDCCVVSLPPVSILTVRPPAGAVPVGILVRVAVAVLVRVAVGPPGVLVGGWTVGVLVRVAVAVLVRVAVAVLVRVAVGVLVRVGVFVGVPGVLVLVGV